MTGGFDQLQRELGAAQRRLSVGRRPPARPRRRVAKALLPALTAAIVVAVVVVAVLAGAGGRHHSVRGNSGSPKPPTDPTQPALSGNGTRTLPCDESIGNQSPPRDMRVVLGVVALPASPGLRQALQTSRTGASSRLFAKTGLSVRAGARFQLIVPIGLRSRLSIGWGNAGEGHVGSIITVAGCRAAHHQWIDFAGGYWVTRPMCAALIVAAEGRRRRVQIGIGKACPGQLPPPQPSQR
jgi:hypothetical protein